MAILDSELQMYLSEVITDDGTNGGRMDIDAVVSGAAGNVWPPVFKAERDAGSTKYRKTFLKVADDDDGILYAPQIWIDNITAGDDWVLFFPATQTDVQSGITGAEDCYGVAELSSNVIVGASTITVEVEDSSMLMAGGDAIFRNGDTIRITNKDTPTSGTGTEEIHVINGVPVDAGGNTITITLTGTLANAYNTTDNSYGTRIMSVYEPGDIESSYSAFVDTTAGDGVYNDTLYPPYADNIGTIEQTITITMTSATTFTAASNVAGVTLSGGTIVAGQTWSPINSDFSKPYVNLDYDGFELTWASGDTIVFTIHPMSAPFWQKRVVPAAANSISGNKTLFIFTGESL